MSKEVFVLFYTTRSDTGKPEQQWSHNVYLTDHWEICWSKDEAIQNYEKLFKEDCSLDVHSAGIAPIDAEYRTDWY